MRKFAAFMLVILMASAVWAQAETAKGASKGFAWRDFSGAFAEAQTAKKMVFVDIYTNW